MENNTLNHTSTVSRKQASTLVVTHHQLSTNSTQIGHAVHQLHKALPRTNTSFNVMRGLLLQCIQIPRSTYTLANYWNIHAFLSTTTIAEHSHTYHTTFHPPFTHKTHPEIAYLLVAHSNLVSAELHRFMCVYMISNWLKSIFVSGTQQYASPSS